MLRKHTAERRRTAYPLHPVDLRAVQVVRGKEKLAVPSADQPKKSVMHDVGSLLGPEGVGFDVPYRHRVIFTMAAFDPANPMTAGAIGRAEYGPRRCVAVVDDGVANAWPDLAGKIAAYATSHSETMELIGDPLVVAGGEACKEDRAVVDQVVTAIHEGGLCRQSCVLAVGGGAVLDAVGYATATAHRGIGLVRLPTTTLAQDDAGIGVKNGINAFGKKNFLGTFGVPLAVINDTDFLTTLSDRDWRSGFAEAVKVACLKDAAFFDDIEASAACLNARDMQAAVPVLRTCAALHLDHIVHGGDPFEIRTARPLDFGHWSAHKLEQISKFDVRHGEAVAIGIALDTAYAAIVGIMPWKDADRVIAALRGLGFSLYHEALEDSVALLGGLEEFREHLGGRLTITLLEGIGRPIDVHEMDPCGVSEAIRHLAERESDRKCAG